MVRTGIVATGFYVPEDVLTNDFFIQSPHNPYKVYIGKDRDGNSLYSPDRVQLTEEKILSNTGGILQRRRSAEGQDVVDLVCKAFATTGFPASELEGILIGTISDDKGFPSVGCRVQTRIGAKNVVYAGDVRYACSGFTHALDQARLHVQESGGYWLAAGVEILTRLVDYEELNCDLFGDGCGLAIVGPMKDAERGILATQFRSDISGIDYIFKDKTGKLRMPQGPKVFLKAVRGMIDIAHDLSQRARIPDSQITRYIVHQANGRILDKVEEEIDPEKRGKIVRTIQDYGNMSAATVPVALAKSIREGTLKEGDLATLVDMGSGLTFGGILVRI
ncbi:MAG: ketoacyl-ACP synthase III [Nanoarchaeota archaeon]